LDGFEDEVGSETHPHADQKLGDDQERPIGQGVSADPLPDRWKQEQRERNDKSCFDPRRNRVATQEWREEHEPGKPNAYGQQSADDGEEGYIYHRIYP